MKIKPQRSGAGPARTRALHGAMAAALLCAGWFNVYSAVAQVGAEAGALMKGGPASAPAAMGKGPMQMTISMTPAPAAGAAAAAAGPLRGPNCVGAVRESTSVSVPLGKSMLVPMPEPVRNRTIGNPAVAQAAMVSPQTLYILGLSVGTTNMIVQGKSGACRIIDVAVGADAGGLQASLAQLMPGERDIHVSTAADTIVLAGNVSSSQAAQQAAAIAKAYANSGSGNGANGENKGGNVLNMLTVTAPQQVMLEVKVAEVSKTLINQLGSAFNIQGGFGSWSGALVSNLLAGVASGIVANKANNRPFSVAVDAQNTDNLVKILAEPNLVTISGQEATFLAGGKIFIPVPQSNTGGGTTITLQEEEFGVALKFLPTVLSNGRISLKVAPEVSELSQTGVTLTATNVAGASILPLITTRRASTTVQMADGETFAIGGLIKDNVSGSLKAVPGIGEIPVLGALARSTSFQQDRTELIFIITPHLVKPLQTADVPLPTDSFTRTNEADVFATGNMEGRGGLRKHGRMPASEAAPAQPMPQSQAPAPEPEPAPAPAPKQQSTPAATAALPAPRAPQADAAAKAVTSAVPVATQDVPAKPLVETHAPVPAPAPAPEPAKAESAPAAALPNAAHAADDATAARIARIEAAAARIAAANQAAPAQPAPAKRRTQQVARANAAPSSTDH
ncbi:type II and III secretion system protein family protein [Burkholderia stagnalis]|uniref:type II and III secretion system protein family protein n=1 Tax=Burkholderia stagnalis TaxID=1503054 RepID=UPI000F5D1558|nr:type II and III secretion system protein family protein [Burkholderia stagnalis]RQY26084.1 type II and III secretion system protein family protein [Burkholderia stagnalis]RQY97213.1 type II and III secretion system protein family protein [Burkholderia stagnalis]RQZ06617.1 type II and III secretion system protein family protein [Burkholderia stagnalis]